MAGRVASDSCDRDIETLLANYRDRCQADDLARCPDLATIDCFVRDKHAHQTRKDGSPYYNHVKNVGDIARQLAAAWPMSSYGAAVCAAAGLLHDCQEDQGVDFEDIEEVANNAEVAVLVAFVSDDKRLPSAFRHQRYLERLAAAPLRAQIVKLADLIDNGRDALRALDPAHPRAGRQVPASQQLDNNKHLWRWARKARDIMGVLTLVSKLDEYMAALASIDLVLEKAEADSGLHSRLR